MPPSRSLESLPLFPLRTVLFPGGLLPLKVFEHRYVEMTKACMNAFRGLANVSQATLANVAPGIAEALIATAIGLFAAIPAVVAYNRFTHDVDRLAVRFETFIEEFSNILQRQG